MLEVIIVSNMYFGFKFGIILILYKLIPFIQIELDNNKDLKIKLNHIKLIYNLDIG